MQGQVDSGEAGRAPCTIEAPYMLAVNAGVLRAPDGRFYVEGSWATDLFRHFVHLKQFVFVAPYWDVPWMEGLIPLPSDVRLLTYKGGGLRQAFKSLPRLVAILLREMPRVRFVQSGIAGAPFPVGWVAVPLARLMGKRVVITVESAFWRLRVGERAGVRRRLSAWAWERLNRWCIATADYVGYQTLDYQRSLPATRAGGGVIYQASWITRADIREPVDVVEMWDRRIAAGVPPRFLFASRMVEEKGPRILAEAMRQLEGEGADIHLDVIGAGPELEGLRALTGSAWGESHVRILDPIPYGPEFFSFLRNYDAVLVPSLSDEQPRIVYDAYAQGVPSIASDTPGLTICVVDGETGRIVPPGDAAALAAAMRDAATNRARTRGWGMAGRERALLFTHEHMHEDRCRELQKLL